MNSRINILTQILLISHEYDIEILNIEFININSITDEVKVKFKIEYDSLIVKYIYEKDNMYEVNYFIYYFQTNLRKIKGGRIND